MALLLASDRKYAS